MTYTDLTIPSELVIKQIQSIQQPSRGMDNLSQGEFIEEFKEILMLTLASTALFDTCVLPLDVGIV